MEKEDYKFTFKKENGEEVECELVFDFYSDDRKRNYMLITDNTTDEDGELNVYAYYTDPDNDDLLPVEDDAEFELVSSVFNEYKEGVR